MSCSAINNENVGRREMRELFERFRTLFITFVSRIIRSHIKSECCCRRSNQQENPLSGSMKTTQPTTGKPVSVCMRVKINVKCHKSWSCIRARCCRILILWWHFRNTAYSNVSAFTMCNITSESLLAVFLIDDGLWKKMENGPSVITLSFVSLFH